METIILLLYLIPFAIFGRAEATDVECNNTPWRLPKNILPTNYEIHLQVLDPLERTNFYGAVIIDITIIKETDRITLHAKDLTLDEDTRVEYRTANGDIETVRIVHRTIDEEHEMIHLRTESPLAENSSYQIYIPHFIGKIRDGRFGYSRILAENYADGDLVAIATLLSPTYARAVFPCFDEPNKKTKFTIHLHQPATYTSYTNIPFKDMKRTHDNTRREVIYEQNSTLPLNTISILFANDLVKNNMERFYTYVNLLVPLMIPGYEDAVPVLKGALENYTDIPFPKVHEFNEKGFIQYSQGDVSFMHHFGLPLEDKSRQTSPLLMQCLYRHRSHTLAQEYFGDLVTPDWWSYTWLNQALSKYFAYIITDQTHPEWRLQEQFLNSQFQQALLYDGEANSLPMTHRVCSPPEIAAFLKYRLRKNRGPTEALFIPKGASIIRMFHGILGKDELFQSAIRAYLNDRMMKSARPADFFRAFDKINSGFEQSHLPENMTFEDVAAKWTEQAGVPLITVARNYGRGTVHVKQERFYNHLNGRRSDTRWWIPLTWMTATSPENHQFLGPQNWLYDSKTFTVEAGDNDWILFNRNATGYYRVNYDDKNWNLLAQALEISPYKFPAVNRAQLLDDAFALSFGGRLNFGIALNMTRFLLGEDDPIVWMSVLRNLEDLYEYVSDDIVRLQLKNYYQRLLSRIIDLTNREQFDKGHLTAAIEEIGKQFLLKVFNISNGRQFFEVDELEWIERPLLSPEEVACENSIYSNNRDSKRTHLAENTDSALSSDYDEKPNGITNEELNETKRSCREKAKEEHLWKKRSLRQISIWLTTMLTSLKIQEFLENIE